MYILKDGICTITYMYVPIDMNRWITGSTAYQIPIMYVHREQKGRKQLRCVVLCCAVLCYAMLRLVVREKYIIKKKTFPIQDFLQHLLMKG